MPKTLDDYLKTPKARTPRVAKAREVFDHSYTLAVKLTELREHHGLTQTQLAELTGVPQAQISRIERGVVDPRYSTLRKLFGALGTELTPTAIAG